MLQLPRGVEAPRLLKRSLPRLYYVVVVVIVIVIVDVVVVVWDTVECVCMYTTPQTCKATAVLETWACAPLESSYPSPGMYRTDPINVLIATPLLTINT